MRPTPQEARDICRDVGAPGDVIAHVEAVTRLALALADAKGDEVDRDLVAVGALLHDVGRAFSHDVDHVPRGAAHLRDLGVDEDVIRIVERHMGAGITEQEAYQFGWPMERTYIPITLEERIVCHADNLTHGTSWMPLETTLEKFQKRDLPLVAARVQALHELLTTSLGVDPDEVVARLSDRSSDNG